MGKTQKSLTELLSLEGQRAVITGAAAGIGAAVANRLGEAGADLILVDVNADKLSKVKQQVSQYDCDVVTATVDVAVKAEIDAFWDTMEGATPSILVNNAGIFPMRPFLETDPKFVDHVLAVNLYGAWWMCHHLIRRRLKNGGGVIVNVGSIEAILPFREEMVHYDVSKAGVIAMSRALAKDFGRKGFRVNTILPGGIITPGTKAVAKQILKLKLDLVRSGMAFKSRLPAGRFGKPDEIARMILVLCSDLAAYMFGAVVPVDGGFLSA